MNFASSYKIGEIFGLENVLNLCFKIKIILYDLCCEMLTLVVVFLLIFSQNFVGGLFYFLSIFQEQFLLN